MLPPSGRSAARELVETMTPDVFLLLSQISAGLPLLAQQASLAIVVTAATHLALFGYLWWWHRRDLRAVAGALDQFTRGVHQRSVLDRNASLPAQIEAFLLDLREVLSDDRRRAERAGCWSRMRVLDERRPYLDSSAFETVSNMARTMIEAYPLAGVLGTILAIGAALQVSDAGTAAESAEMAATMSTIVARFGDAIWSTFFGLGAAILLMFVQSLLEPRFGRMQEIRSEVREVVALAKRELATSVEADTPSVDVGGGSQPSPETRR